MPRSAIDFVGPDRIVTLAELGRTLCELVDEPIEQGEAAAVADGRDQPADQVEVEVEPSPSNGEASLLTCPDCGGVLMESEEGGVVRFACQVGHAYSPDSLVERQGDALESALWQALRTLEERADLLNRMARRASRRGSGDPGSRLEHRASAIGDHAAEIRNTILRLRNAEADEEPAAEPAP
jgi:two-component system chemotaxis response regulator CheB